MVIELKSRGTWKEREDETRAQKQLAASHMVQRV